LQINPPERHGHAMAVFGVGTICGPIMGPALGVSSLSCPINQSLILNTQTFESKAVWMRKAMLNICQPNAAGET